MDELRSGKNGLQRAVSGLRMKLPINIVGSEDDGISTPDSAHAIVKIADDKMIIYVPHQTRNGKDVRDNTERIIMEYLVDKGADVTQKKAEGEMRTKLIVSDVDESSFL